MTTAERHQGPMGRQARTLILISLTFFVFLVIATAMAMHYNTKPEFCASCHYMQPYYDSWQASSHRGVACVECHYPPGVRAGIEKKFEGLAQLVTYVTGTQGSMPSAQVEDASCLREGCHETRLLEGKPHLFMGKVKFDHKGHLTPLRRGKKLRCTSCHSQRVQGTHMMVTASTCYLCHFQGYSEPELADGCGRCHPTTPEDAARYKQPQVHKQTPHYGTDCFSCHRETVSGTGEVPQGRCLTCHNEPERLNKYNETDFLHTKHITENKIDCLRCHTEIVHSAQMGKAASEVEPAPGGVHPASKPGDCASCHGDQHNEQRLIYSGRGGVGVDPMPSRMFKKRVGCNACHKTPNPKREGFPLATAADCMSCHGTGISETIDGWKQSVDATLANSQVILEVLEKELDQHPNHPKQKAARELFDQASTNVRLVEKGGGLHNVAYAQALLKKSAELANQARATLGLAARFGDPKPASPIWSENGEQADQACAVTCHEGIEQKTVRVFGINMPHGKHVLKTEGQVDCSVCHDKPDYPARDHGQVTVTPEDCQSCHHPREDLKETCSSCHTETQKVYNGYGGIGLNGKMRRPSPMAAAEPHVACASCHPKATTDRKLIAETCRSCHKKAEAGYADELADWIKRSKFKLDQTDALLQKVKTEFRFLGPVDDKEMIAQIQKAIAQAEHDIELIRTGRGSHNVDYSIDLLSEAQKPLNAALRRMQPPPPR